MNILIALIVSIFVGVSFYFNYEAQLHIEKQVKEIQIYKSKIKSLTERLLILQELEEKKKALEITIKDQEEKISQQSQDIENLKLLIIKDLKSRKDKKL
jgi:hypothetical protein